MIGVRISVYLFYVYRFLMIRHFIYQQKHKQERNNFHASEFVEKKNIVSIYFG
jgi:hypothetical protein